MSSLYGIKPAMDFVARSAEFSLDKSLFFQINPPSSYALRPPCVWDESAIHDEEMRHVMKHRFNMPRREIKEIGVYHFHDAMVLGTGMVLTEEGMVAETLNRYALKGDNYELSGLDTPEASLRLFPDSVGEHINKPAVLLRKPGDTNYGHWITELLPKVWMLEGIFHPDWIFLVPDKKGMHSVYRDTLAMAGIDEGKIRPIRDDEMVYCDHLIFPSPMSYHPIWKSPRGIDYLEMLQRTVIGSSSERKYPEKIFVSREDVYPRQIDNKSDVVECVKGHGYEVVETGGLSVAEQMLLFSQAKCLAGMFGSSMANMLFAPRGADVLLLAPNYLPGFFYWDNSCHKEQRYHQIHGAPSVRSRMDYLVDVEGLDRVLRNVGIQ